MARERGVVKWFDEAKNFGFITPNGQTKKDIFFHRSDLDNLEKSIETGAMVEFEVEPGTKGPQAKRITVVV